MNRHSLIKIEGQGSYVCRMNSQCVIIKTEPHSDFLTNKTIHEVYQIGSGKAKFTYIGPTEAELIVAEDIYEKMIDKNPKLAELAVKFDLDLCS